MVAAPYLVWLALGNLGSQSRPGGTHLGSVSGLVSLPEAYSSLLCLWYLAMAIISFC